MNPLVNVLAAVIATGILILAGAAVVAVGRRFGDGRLATFELSGVAGVQRQLATSIRAGGSTTVERPLETEDQQIDVTEDRYDVSRRRFFNRATFAIFGLVVAQFTLTSLAFMWPKLKKGFGTTYNAGKVDALKAEIIEGKTVVPKFFPAAQAWVIPIELDVVPGSSFTDLPDIVTGGTDDGIGLMALWMRCPHLGCRVPECIPSQGFECPCHGSKFNIHGEYFAGPSPRNMDRFNVSINEQGELIIDTGTIIQTARSKTYTAEYPAGPNCN
ncbi:MAG: ubiquinol-cytochrome c reductase iron-sulfur subunit [Acidimicrobiia bacterium]